MPTHGVPDTRENWQRGANRDGDSQEIKVFDVILRIATKVGSHICVIRKPNDFKHIFYEMDMRKHPDAYHPTDVPGVTWFDESTNRFMYNREDGTSEPVKGGGMVPDIMIKNTTTGKWVLIEVKRQNAAGNAHERMFRYIPLIPEFKSRSGVENPFMACVCGPIVHHPKYRAEIRSSFECCGLGEYVHLVQDEKVLEDWVWASPLHEITHAEPSPTL